MKDLLDWPYPKQPCDIQRLAAHPHTAQDTHAVAEAACASQELYRPASTQDLLDGSELEQRMVDDGRLPDILTDPELMPDWQAQLDMQQAS